MLLQRLQEIIPKPYFEFPKGLNDEDPYVFVKWAEDRAGNYCMYYKFPSRNGQKMNQKRVVIKELEILLRNRLEVNDLWISRETFNQHYPITKSAGTCGFVVSCRMLEYLKIATYHANQGIQLHNPDLVREILE